MEGEDLTDLSHLDAPGRLRSHVIIGHLGLAVLVLLRLVAVLHLPLGEGEGEGVYRRE